MICVGDVEHAELIARASQIGFDKDMDTCISRVVDRRFLGGFILCNYSGSIIYAHMAGVGGHWCSPQLMWVVFDYCFEQLGVKKVMCTVGSNNAKSLSQVKRAGFHWAYSIADGIPNGELHLFSMLRDQCKWLTLRKRFLRANGHHRGEHIHAHA